MDETPEQWFHRRATHYVEAQVLFHLGQAGVFHQLDSAGACSIEELAAELDLVPEVLATCMEYVHGIDGLLSIDEESRYGLTEFGEAVLARFGRTDGETKHFNFFQPF